MGRHRALVSPHVTGQLGKIAALCGPTGSGKTVLAVQLRQAGLPIEVVSCDALQVYCRLDAGTAKPTADQRAAVPTHLVDCWEAQAAMTAGQWADLADAAIAEITARGGWPLIVGGTGLYLRALVRGLAPIPTTNQQLRDELQAQWQQLGPEAMHAALAEIDPDYAAKTPAANRQRVTRALEVHAATGRSLSDWHRDHAALESRYACALAVLQPDRAVHTAGLQVRARAMAEPLVQEVRALLANGLHGTEPAMQALGYRDAVQAVRDQLGSQQLAAQLVAAHTAYAKRQRTWFAAEPAVLRLDPADPDTLGRLTDTLRAWFESDAPFVQLSDINP